MDKPEVLFERWYGQPLSFLEGIENGDGGFIALAISCLLYERYTRTILGEEGAHADDRAVLSLFARDMGVQQDAAKAFWQVMRNGLLHAAMPKSRARPNKDCPRYMLLLDLPLPIQWGRSADTKVLLVQPWLVMQRVLDLWRQNIDLLDRYELCPWANVVPVRLGAVMESQTATAAQETHIYEVKLPGAQDSTAASE